MRRSQSAPPNSLKAFHSESDMRTQRGLRGSGGFGRGTVLLEVVRCCTFVPARLAVPLGAHVDTAFWRFILLALGAELEPVRGCDAA